VETFLENHFIRLSVISDGQTAHAPDRLIEPYTGRAKALQRPLRGRVPAKSGHTNMLIGFRRQRVPTTACAGDMR